MENFTPISAFVGGILIGSSAALFLLFNGRITGVSGIVGGLFSLSSTGKTWRILFVAGLILSGFVYQLLFPGSFIERQDFPLWLLMIGAFIVGFGTDMGSGCTSGHGICGIGRLSRRSIVATILFMLSGFVTVFLIRHVFELT